MRHSYLLAVLLLLVACSKDQRNSRRLDGKWHATVFMGEDPDNFNESYLFTFNRDEKGEGTGTLEWTDGNFTSVYGIRYFFKNDNLCLIIDGETIAFTIGELTRKEITLTDASGETTILRKH